MKPKSPRERRYDFLTYLTMLKEEIALLQDENFLDDDLLEDDDNQNSDGDEEEFWQRAVSR